MDILIEHSHPYLLERGIHPSIAEQFELGVSTKNGIDFAFFAVHNQHGVFVDYVLRVLDKSEPKYHLPAGFAKTQYVYNYHRAQAAKRSALVVVEGFVDAIKVHQAGYPSVVALMGVSMSITQENLMLRWWEHFIFMLDGDKAGRSAQKDLMERINKRGVKGVYGINLPDGVQPDQLQPEQIQHYMKGGR